MKRIVPIVTLLLLAGWAASPGLAQAQNSVRLDDWEVVRENNDVIVTWIATSESGVDKYVLIRKTPFMSRPEEISFKAHGAGKTYRFVDDQLYKLASDQVDYRLEAVYTNGVHVELFSHSISYTPTAIRRTWGSIKAMFQ